MKYANNKRAIEELGAFEGVFTAAQAQRLGIPRYALSYAVKAGTIERIGHGAYRLAATMDDGLDGIRAAYKLTSPSSFSHERMAVTFDGVAVSGPTAAHVLGIGDFHPEPFQVTVPKRFNTRRHDVRYVVSTLAEDDVVWKEGVAVTRPERTVADLLASKEDASLVAGALVDAIRRYGSTSLDMRELERLVGCGTVDALLSAAGVAGDGMRLVNLDDRGHVALIGEE